MLNFYLGKMEVQNDEENFPSYTIAKRQSEALNSGSLTPETAFLSMWVDSLVIWWMSGWWKPRQDGQFGEMLLTLPAHVFLLKEAGWVGWYRVPFPLTAFSWWASTMKSSLIPQWGLYLPLLSNPLNTQCFLSQDIIWYLKSIIIVIIMLMIPNIYWFFFFNFRYSIPLSRNFEQEFLVFAFMSYSWLSLLLACKLLCWGSYAFSCYDQDRKAICSFSDYSQPTTPENLFLTPPPTTTPNPHPRQLWCHGKRARLGTGRPCLWVNSCVTFRKSFCLAEPWVLHLLNASDNYFCLTRLPPLGGLLWPHQLGKELTSPSYEYLAALFRLCVPHSIVIISLLTPSTILLMSQEQRLAHSCLWVPPFWISTVTTAFLLSFSYGVSSHPHSHPWHPFGSKITWVKMNGITNMEPHQSSIGDQETFLVVVFNHCPIQ